MIVAGGRVASCRSLGLILIAQGWSSGVKAMSRRQAQGRGLTFARFRRYSHQQLSDVLALE
jgi:hypothetical protein